jgi:hypothetical protein
MSDTPEDSSNNNNMLTPAEVASLLIENNTVVIEITEEKIKSLLVQVRRGINNYINSMKMLGIQTKDMDKLTNSVLRKRYDTSTGHLTVTLEEPQSLGYRVLTQVLQDDLVSNIN